MKTNVLSILGISLLSAFNTNAQNCTTPSLANATICAGSTYTIANSSPDKLMFYNSNLTPIGVANSLTVAPLTNSVISYNTYEYVGAPSNTIGAGGYYTTIAKIITFNTFTNVIINSIDVYPQNAGSINVAVKNSAGTIVNQATVTVPSGGAQTLPLGFNVPTGNGYQMELISESCGGLYRNSAGNAFPYNSPSGIISLISTDYAALGYYYYFYNWSVSNAGCVKTLTISTSKATPTITASGKVLSAGSFSVYQWSFNNAALNGATSSTYTVTQNGVYTVTVTNSFGCKGTATFTVNNINTSVAENTNDNSLFSFYPNPAKGIVNLLFSPVKVSMVNLYSLTGQLVKHVSLEGEEQGLYELDVQDLENGIYFIQMKSGSKSTTQKLIISK